MYNKTVFVTHAHLDHIGGLPFVVSTRCADGRHSKIEPVLSLRQAQSVRRAVVVRHPWTLSTRAARVPPQGCPCQSKDRYRQCRGPACWQGHAGPAPADGGAAGGDPGRHAGHVRAFTALDGNPMACELLPLSPGGEFAQLPGLVVRPFANPPSGAVAGAAKQAAVLKTCFVLALAAATGKACSQPVQLFVCWSISC